MQLIPNRIDMIKVSQVIMAAAAIFFQAIPGANSQTSPTAQNENRGPISIRNAGPFNLLFLQFVPESTDVESLHHERFGLQFDIINNLLVPAVSTSSVLEDNEYQRLTMSWKKGLRNNSEISIFVPILWRNGGILDGILSSWHSLFGISGNADDDPAGRDSHPKYSSILRMIDSNGKTLVNQANGFGLGDISLTYKRNILRLQARSGLAWRVGVKIPTGNPVLLLGSGGFDAGVSLDSRYSLGRDTTLYVNMGLVAQVSAGKAPHPEHGMFQGLLACEYHPNSRDSYILQIDANSQPVRTGNPFADRTPVTATFGYRRKLCSSASCFASFSENGDIHNYTLPSFSNIGPDFTISTGIEWRR